MNIQVHGTNDLREALEKLHKGESMSECGEKCDCYQAQAKRLLEAHKIEADEFLVEELAKQIEQAAGKCPQSCGKKWMAECSCSTAEIKAAVLERTTEVRKKKVKRKGEGIEAMMRRLNEVRTPS